MTETPIARTVLRNWQDANVARRIALPPEAATMRAPPEISVKAPDRPTRPANLAWLILILSLAPTVGLGIGRFAYSLVLPDMRDSLGWSYSSAGFMNTINAAGYLGGALIAAPVAKRFGLAASARWSTAAAVASLALCALTGNFIVLSFARLLVGVAAAIGFVAGGTLAATIAQSQPARSNFLLSLFYIGPGIGILSSGLVAPFVLQYFGPGSWWIVWWAMTMLATVLTVPMFVARFDIAASSPPTARGRFAIRPVIIFLAAYFLFGAGYIAYMTFMIAYVRDGGGDALAQSAFWSLIGLSALGTPWIWRRTAQPRPRRHRHDHRPLRQCHRRGNAAAGPLSAFARPVGAGVRRGIFRGGGLDHGVRSLQLSARGMAGRNRGDDHFIRHRADAGADRGRRDHRRHGQPVLCAQRLGGDARGRRESLSVRLPASAAPRAVLSKSSTR